MTLDSQHGYFLWTELLTRDPEPARAFYRAVFSWSLETFPGSDPPYTMWCNGGGPFGGIERIPAGAEGTPGWLPYIGVLDVDAAVIRAQEEGGVVRRPPEEIQGAGRFAVLADPCGVGFAVYRSATEQAPPDPLPRNGDFSWRELGTSDVDRALEFYGEMFGWTRGAVQTLAGLGTYVLLEHNGRPFGGVRGLAEGESPAWTSYVRVPDAEDALTRIAAAGGGCVRPPQEVPGGEKIALGADPEGVPIALHQLTA